MRVIGSFNKLSDDAKKRIKPLAKGEVANYRLINARHDAATGKKLHGASKCIVCRDTISDGDNIVTIGVPEKIEKGEVVRVKKFRITSIGNNLLTNGVFSLYGGNVEHQEFYEFFELCNENASNPERDPSVTAKFERIDEVAEATAEANNIDLLTEALLRAQTMTANERKAFAASKNWNTKEHPALLATRIKKYAQKHPDLFMDSLGNTEEKDMVVIKEALEAGVVEYHPAEHKIVWGGGEGGTLAKLDRNDGDNPVEAFNNWIKASKNGANIMKSINNRLKAASKDAE